MDKKLTALVASGVASLEDMRRLGAEEVARIKQSAPYQRRAQAHDVVCKGDADDTRTVQFIASDETPDRMGDVIRVSGWDLKNFKKNPVLLWQHDTQSIPPIGTVSRAIKGKSKGDSKALLADAKFEDAETHPFADTVFKLVKNKTVRAVSVGFLPQKSSRPESEEERAKLGIGEFGVLFEKQELLELSVVSVPANPSAVQQSIGDMVKRGYLAKSQADEFAKQALGVEPDDYYERAKTLAFDFSGVSDDIAKLFGDGDGDAPAEDAPAPSTDEGVPEGQEGGESPEAEEPIEEEASEEDGGEEVVDEGADKWAANYVSVASPPTFVLSGSASNQQDPMLVAALARLIEAQAEQTTATRQLVDVVSDLARKVVDLADAPQRNAAASNGERSDRDEALSEEDLSSLLDAIDGVRARVGRATRSN
jgi:HK97 family phage prohead protease